MPAYFGEQALSVRGWLIVIYVSSRCAAMLRLGCCMRAKGYSSFAPPTVTVTDFPFRWRVYWLPFLTM